jgi:hypothetical protein
MRRNHGLVDPVPGYGTVTLVNLKKTARLVLLVALLGIGVGANVMRATGMQWPRWMDGRYGGPLPWSMFAAGMSSSQEIIGVVSFDDGSQVEVGRGIPAIGPEEWVWTSEDAWHVFAAFKQDAVDWQAAARYAARAAGGRAAMVTFVLRDRTSDAEGTARTVDTPLAGPFDVSEDALG